MTETCHFCLRVVDSSKGYVDIGGIVFCVGCYRTRSTRTQMPCDVCGELKTIVPDPLLISAICEKCETNADLNRAYTAARNHEPCDVCKGVQSHHHPTTYGLNLCHSCYHIKGRPCTQLYPGDKGYPHCHPDVDQRPSLPAVVLRVPDGFITMNPSPCVVCDKILHDPGKLVGWFGLPSLCEGCRGPTWWDYMDEHYNELKKKDMK